MTYEIKGYDLTLILVMDKSALRVSRILFDRNSETEKSKAKKCILSAFLFFMTTNPKFLAFVSFYIQEKLMNIFLIFFANVNESLRSCRALFWKMLFCLYETCVKRGAEYFPVACHAWSTDKCSILFCLTEPFVSLPGFHFLAESLNPKITSRTFILYPVARGFCFSWAQQCCLAFLRVYVGLWFTSHPDNARI